MKRAQTATEYLIITAVVIIIALVVISTLGGVTFMGGSSTQQMSELQLRSLDVGVIDLAHEDDTAQFRLRNNQPQTIRIRAVSLGGIPCLNSEIILLTGETRLFECAALTISDLQV